MIIFVSCWWNLFTAQTCTVIYLTQPVRYNELYLSYMYQNLSWEIQTVSLGHVLKLNLNYIHVTSSNTWSAWDHLWVKAAPSKSTKLLYNHIQSKHVVCYQVLLLNLSLNYTISRWHQVIRISGSWQQMTWWLNYRKTPLNWMTTVKGRSVCSAV